MSLGEMRGQLRELIHTVNNTAQKLDAVSMKVMSSAELPTKITALELRITALETDRNRRDGAAGIISTILRSPALGWLIGAAITAWAILTGKVHI